MRQEKMRDNLLGDDKIKLITCAHKDTDTHNHEFLEMVYVTDGKAMHTLNGKKTVVKKGDYFIIDYKACHKYNAIDDKPYTIINCLFRPEFIDKTLVDCRGFQDLINNYLIKFSYQTLADSPTSVIFRDDDGAVLPLIARLQSEYAGKNQGYLEIMRCYLIEIIIKTMRKISRNDADELNHTQCRHITKYVDENYMKPITLSGLSAELNFSLPYLSKRFKNDAGVSFSAYLQKRRIEQSCRLIANTDKKISEIAELVGYNDVKFFNAVFKKHMKLTPREFKKFHR
ncbi:MAG: AraC family transcriptional regulator [Clostridiales bacterium]|jgi:YesN/AraC family two-component response regulator|nr:AraC family transcriptional regulator [Clostridiales bacterium]